MNRFDLSRLSTGSATETATEPRRIFAALPAKDPKYSYPRDVQSEVWERWYERRGERDIVVKMNTGGGKTVVGLLMLKSSLNEGKGPAVYITPDIFLTEQVKTEAIALGIEITEDPNSSRFRTGRAILVANIYKLVNGLSVFGVQGSSRRSIEVGTLLIDDAHACLTTVEDQFSLSIKKDHPAYPQLLDLFREDLEAQTGPGYRDLAAGDRSAVIPIPYWAWVDKRERVLAILHPHRDEDDVKFVWPLLAESLSLCKAAISADEVQAKPPCIPIERITAFDRAQSRLYLTATLSDDSVLVTHFAADPKSVANPITPKTADDLGDRMILVPQDTHPTEDEGKIRALIASLAGTKNVVVIVPSRRRAEAWSSLAVAIHDSASIQDGVEALRNGHVGLIVLINKYDGIDLPYDACRILVLDGLPEAYGAIDRAEANALEDTPAFMSRQIQRIEQGMGRGVRSNDDYCVVFLLGSRLTERIWASSGSTAFSPAARKQLDLSQRLADMIRGESLHNLRVIIDQCLNRDPGWLQSARSALDGVTYDPGRVRQEAVAEREAFRLAGLGQFRAAADHLRAASAACEDKLLRGWLHQQTASYLHHVDPVAAQALQQTAISENRGLFKPRAGIEYVRLKAVADQADKCSAFLSTSYAGGTELILSINALLEDLEPNPDLGAVRRFEAAFYQLGLHLGFGSQRPEHDTGAGPDVLWSVGNLDFHVVECKSGVTTETISKHDAAQLGHSMEWFNVKYDDTCNATPVLVHNTNVQHPGVYLKSSSRIITFERLGRLRETVREFASAIADHYRSPEAVRHRLIDRKLNAGQFLQTWSVTGRARN